MLGCAVISAFSATPPQRVASMAVTWLPTEFSTQVNKGEEP